MEAFDSHCHLGRKNLLEDLDAVLAQARKAGVCGIMDVGIDLETSRAALDRTRPATKEQPQVTACAGLHPCDCRNYEASWPEIETLCRDDRCSGIGETGLDLYWDSVPLETQRASLDLHLGLSKSLGKPVVLHCRDAFSELIEQLKDHAPIHGVMHCFTGNQEQAEQFLAIGLFLSFAGPVTYPKNKDLREAARLVPEDRLLVETDAPFLPPQEYRGKRNEPAYVIRTIEVIAETRGTSPEALAQACSMNTRRHFGVDG